MTSDTLRQKYIYNVPFDDNEQPLVKLDLGLKGNASAYTINATDLYFMEENSFITLCKNIDSRYSGIVINNDHDSRSKNRILENSNKCYLLSFAYLFKKAGFKCNIKW